MLARHFDLPFEFFSAVLSGIKEVKEFMARAEQQRKLFGKPMILFIDEIHRFNKAQQAAFLPYVEKGDIILFGSTTENPSFEVIAPLLSRTRVLVLKELDREALGHILQDALEDKERGLGASGLAIDPGARDMLIDYANGDARRALNTLEIAAGLARGQDASPSRTSRRPSRSGRSSTTSRARSTSTSSRPSTRASATATSTPRSTGWSGCWPRARTRSTSPGAWSASPPRTSAWPTRRPWPSPCTPRRPTISSARRKGSWPWPRRSSISPRRPKSNRIYTAYGAVQKEIERSPHEPVPLQIRNAVTSLMKEIGYGKDYQYAHDSAAETTDMETMPERLKGRKYYEPGELGFEKEIRKRIEWWDALKARIREGKRRERDEGKKGEPRPQPSAGGGGASLSSFSLSR